MLPIKIRRLGAHLAKSVHLATRDTSVDKTLNTHGRQTGREGAEAGDVGKKAWEETGKYRLSVCLDVA